MIGKNNVVASLRPLGYRFVTFATGFDPTEHPEADVYLSPHPYISGFERMLIDMTPMQRVWPDPRYENQYTLARQRILYLLDHLPDVARNPAPTFTLAHVLCPASPVHLRRGWRGRQHSESSAITSSTPTGQGRFRSPEHFRQAYRSQAAFITPDREDDRSAPGRVARAPDHHPPVGPWLGAVPGL